MICRKVAGARLRIAALVFLGYPLCRTRHGVTSPAEMQVDAAQPGLMVTPLLLYGRAGPESVFAGLVANLTVLGSTVISCKRFATSGVTVS